MFIVEYTPKLYSNYEGPYITPSAPPCGKATSDILGAGLLDAAPPHLQDSAAAAVVLSFGLGIHGVHGVVVYL